MLITENYRKLNADLHKRQVFGQRGVRHALVVEHIIAEFGEGTVLDYGCGRATLASALPERRIHSYDPAIKEYSGEPPACSYVLCTDVLEHVEPECLTAVLRHLFSVTEKLGHFVIATKLDGHKKLADGRDPHLIIQPPEWWEAQLRMHFTGVALVNVSNRDCTFRVTP